MKTTINSLKFATILFLTMAGCVFADLIPDPAAKALGAVDAQTFRLYQRLVGSTWTYAYKGLSTDVTFGQGGSVKTQWWHGATWRITSSNSIAIKNEKFGEMPVHFNAEFKKFTAKDWAGGNGIGTLQTPNAKVSK